MRSLLTSFALAFAVAAGALAGDSGEIRYFRVTVGEIYEGKGFECGEVLDTNWERPRPVEGKHVIRMDTTKYELYDGQKISVVVVADGVVVSEDGTRRVRAWRLVPGRPVKLHD